MTGVRPVLTRASLTPASTASAPELAGNAPHGPPVSAEETIEIFAFMEAADESKRQGGAPVSLDDVLAKARKKAAKLVD